MAINRVYDTKTEGLSTFQSIQQEALGYLGQTAASTAAAAVASQIETLEKQAAALQSSQPAVAAALRQQIAGLRGAVAPKSEGGILDGTIFGFKRKTVLGGAAAAAVGWFLYDRYVR